MFPFFRPRRQTRKPVKKVIRHRRSFEELEDRWVLSAFSVISTNDAGPGTLRQAILDANLNSGADTIDFSTTGVIQLASALPVITGTVNIDGTSAPNYGGTPEVEVDFNGSAGLTFNSQTTGSQVSALALDNASGPGVTFNGGGQNVLVGNYIGLALDGLTVAGNHDNGVTLNASSDNTIGGSSASDRNVISGNIGQGININGSAGNQVLGNYIGTDVSGTLDRGNSNSGVLLAGGLTGNTIGNAGAGNVISGNDSDGVVVNGGSSGNTVAGNTIGLAVDGTTPLGNRLDGVDIQGGSNNVVGNTNQVSSINYYNAPNYNSLPPQGWTGIRAGDVQGDFLITGNSGNNGVLYQGTIDGSAGTTYAVNFPTSLDPNVQSTNAYGPNNLGSGQLQLVGTYKDSTVHGFLFQGTVADLSTAANYQTIDYSGAQYTYLHSTAGGLVVGNYDSAVDHGQYSLPYGAGHAFIYDIATQTPLTDVVYPGSKSNTVYGIWSNGGTSYTLVGGYSLDPAANFDDQNRPIGHAYIVDYDSATNTFSNWATYDYPFGTNYLTHFQGISSVEKGVYEISADSVQNGTSSPSQGSWVTIRRNTDGSFGSATWVNLDDTTSGASGGLTSADSVYGNKVVGVVIDGATVIPYQAVVNLSFQLSNVISGNGANGVELIGASGNTIAMNNIGTDAAGTVALGNGGDGVRMIAGSTGNTLGGQATGGNDPTNNVFIRPPQGNLISGNTANGVLITGGSTGNSLSGNFIGTDASGNAALGNSLDGVAIDASDNNALLGCTFQQNPFVFYNVISGNAGNGLRVTNSNNTTIQANFFGMGANNHTAVGNALDGVLVNGSSSNTAMGGPIPLGNVDAANGQNGIEVRDTASFFTTYNTFTGLAAFSNDTHFGNGNDGMLFTSTGGNILVRTNVVTENGHDGIEIAGNATGVRVAGNIVGLDTYGFIPMGNVGNGIEIDGSANNNLIGGPQPTFNLISQNTISANGNNGVAIDGSAHNNTVNFSDIGTDINGQEAHGNVNAGILLGPGSYSNTIGSTSASLPTIIAGNFGNGIVLKGTQGNTIMGCDVGTDSTDALTVGNGGSGILILNSSNNVIGSPVSGPSTRVFLSGGTSGDSPANVIAYSVANGVDVESGSGNGIRGNSIYSNGSIGINLASGANNNQAAPFISSVVATSSSTQISGNLTSKPKTTFTLEFFGNPNNAQQGKTYLGATTVTTNSLGFATFSFTGGALPSGDTFVTATATDPGNNTSEFSPSAS